MIESATLYVSVFLSFLVIFLTYINVSRFNFWKRQGIKGPKPLPFLGNSFDFMSGPVLNQMEEKWKKYGPIYGIYDQMQPQLVLGDPECIKDVLIRDWNVFQDRQGLSKDGNPITDNFLPALSGNHWKRVRSVMTPTFTSGKMKQMFSIMSGCCETICASIRKRITEGTEEEGIITRVQGKEGCIEINFGHLAGCYSMDVIAKCCFATETNSFEDPNNVFVSHANRFFDVPKLQLLGAFLLPSWIKRLFGLTMNSKDSLAFFAHVSRTLLERRTKRADEQLRGSKDYFQLLIEASRVGQDDSKKDSSETVPDNESHHGYDELNRKINETLIKETAVDELKRTLSEEEVIANSVLFFGAAYDTTSKLVTFATYCLAINPDVQAQLYEELKCAHEQNGAKFDYETISGLKYLDAVISETLRILPPIHETMRQSLTDYTFKKNGIFIPKGGSVSFPIWNLHRDPRFWSEPEKFKPERFLPENREKLLPYAYLPFGGGPRNCIGMRFALLEAKLGIARLILNFKFFPTANTDIPLDLTPTTILVTPKRVFLGMEMRK